PRRVLSQELVAVGLGEGDSPRGSELDGPPRPPVPVREEPEMLVGAREIRITCDDRRRLEGGEALLLLEGREERHRNLEDLDRLVVAPGQVVEARLGHEGAGRLDGILLRVEDRERLAYVVEPARIADRDERLSRQGQ